VRPRALRPTEPEAQRLELTEAAPAVVLVGPGQAQDRVCVEHEVLRCRAARVRVRFYTLNNTAIASRRRCSFHCSRPLSPRAYRASGAVAPVEPAQSVPVCLVERAQRRAAGLEYVLAHDRLGALSVAGLDRRGQLAVMVL
jgi:hypothetical protein